MSIRDTEPVAAPLRARTVPLMTLEDDARPLKRGYTLRKACTYLGLSEWVLRDEMRNNRIAAKKRGTTVLFDRAELDRYFDALPERP